VSTCARGKLAAVLFALADDCRDLGVVIVEDVVEEEDRPLDRRECLEEDEERQGERVRRLRMLGRVRKGLL
jgi:hypothetical protein